MPLKVWPLQCATPLANDHHLVGVQRQMSPVSDPHGRQCVF
eukprot:CAMPEP_0119336310 /NCGR_PEP_ID=MMETSP1333-20130426/91526_1 /TAXON_ID=418940 /ORGANISM="Scyphosphaera apsteinii, Strain RCC1455" /LENGTH=40 /DNA_ID= /DNA_START= /DNA_END= /DNA_ORIENTATION=